MLGLTFKAGYYTPHWLIPHFLFPCPGAKANMISRDCAKYAHRGFRSGKDHSPYSIASGKTIVTQGQGKNNPRGLC